MTATPTFVEFYTAVHGREPFPWQTRLATRVAEGGWPTEIGVPTGLGKTSTLDISVWSLAAQFDRAPEERTVPTRIWYVVNRRLLVDAASDHATRLAALLRTTTDGPIAAVAAQLRRIEGGITSRPLVVSRLRGGSALDARPPHLAQPAIVCATVPMFASRLLFRAYGSSNRVWPIDAALAGTDSLILLDEAHLSIPLRDLIGDLPRCDANRTGVLRAPGRFTPGDGPAHILNAARAYPTLVSLTATGEASPDRFDLDDTDRQHPIVAQRLHAAKPTAINDTTTAQLPTVIAQHVRRLLDDATAPPAILVFVNRPVTARLVHRALETRPPASQASARIVTLTGQLRGPDADNVRRLLLDPAAGCPAGTPTPREQPLVVIATQTLEVGADLDVDHLITESAGVRALTQRFGRLNRLGQRPDATATIVHPTDREAGLYGDEPDLVITRLAHTATPIDLSPATIAAVLGEPADQPPRTPALLPTHLWEWSKTSVPVSDAAPIELFYDGFARPDLTVSLAWRHTICDIGQPLYPPASTAEWVDVPIYEARAFLDTGVTFHTLANDATTLAAITPDKIRPGQRLIIDCDAGGYSTAGWDPDHTTPVTDLSPITARAVSLDASTLTRLLKRSLTDTERDALDRLQPSDDQPDIDDETNAITTIWDAIAPAITAHVPDATLDGLDRVGPDARPWLRWVTNTLGRRTASDALDELSIAPQATLDDHLQHVGNLARRIAHAVGLPESLADAVADAGRFHDLGKADARFQRWLGASPAQLMAKSDTQPGRWRHAQVRSGWPSGARHELLSVQLLDAATQAGQEVPEPVLVRHLVISHHGHGRPSVDTAGHPNTSLPANITVNGSAYDAELDPARIDWEQPARYRELVERYGYWGVAALETIVRQADHIISAVTEVQ